MSSFFFNKNFSFLLIDKVLNIVLLIYYNSFKTQLFPKHIVLLFYY